MSTSNRVIDVIAEHLLLGRDEVFPAADIADDLGDGSLDAVELIMTVEEEFGIAICDQDADKFVMVGDVIAFVERAVH